MKDVTYVGPYEAVILPDGTELPNGVAVSLDDKTADSLGARADFKVSQPKKEKAS
jgi:hypothetical protein